MNKKSIISFLQEKGVYDSSFDFNIDLLLDQIKLYKEARKCIRKKLDVNGDASGTFKVRNPQIKTLTECIGNIKTLSKSLGLSVSDSMIFKQLNEGKVKDDDGFDKAF